MRSIVIVALAATVFAATATAQCTAPSSNALDYTNFGACTTVNTCATSFCTCAGASNSSYPSCLATSTKSCADVTSCAATYMSCLIGLASQRISTGSCAQFGTNVYLGVLSAASGAFSNSSLAVACAYSTCMIRNQSSAWSSCTTMDSTVCASSILLAATTTPPPTTTSGAAVTTSAATPAPTVRADLSATLRISGSNWAAIVNDPVKKANAISVLPADIATLYKISSKFVRVNDISVGSLVVNFDILAGSGQSPAQLVATTNAAGSSSSWLTNTQAVYSTVSTETLTSLGATVTATGAPTTLAPGQTTQAPSSAARASLLFVTVLAVAIASIMA